MALKLTERTAEITFIAAGGGLEPRQAVAAQAKISNVCTPDATKLQLVPRAVAMQVLPVTSNTMRTHSSSPIQLPPRARGGRT